MKQLCLLLTFVFAAMQITAIAQTASKTPQTPKKNYRLPDVILDLKLTDGRFFKNLVVKEVLKYEILVADVNGLQKIDSDLLPIEIQKKYGLDTKEITQYWLDKRKGIEDERIAKDNEKAALAERAKKRNEIEKAKAEKRRFVFGRIFSIRSSRNGYIMVHQGLAEETIPRNAADDADATLYNYLNAPMIPGEQVALCESGNRYATGDTVFLYVVETGEVSSDGYKLFKFEKDIFEHPNLEMLASLTPEEIATQKIQFKETAKKLQDQAAKIREESKSVRASKADMLIRRAENLEADAIRLETEVDKRKEDKRRFVYGIMWGKSTAEKDLILIRQSITGGYPYGRSSDDADSKHYNYLNAGLVNAENISIRNTNNRFTNGDTIFVYVTETDEINRYGSRIYIFEKDIFSNVTSESAAALTPEESSKLKVELENRAKKLTTRAAEVRKQEETAGVLTKSDYAKRVARLEQGAARLQAESEKLK